MHIVMDLINLLQQLCKHVVKHTTIEEAVFFVDPINVPTDQFTSE
jgi:hypothetical protein